MAGVGQFAKLAAALVEGDGSLLEHLLEKKLEDLGEEFIMHQFAGPFGVAFESVGTAQKLSKAIASGGGSEFDRLRKDWLNSLKPAALPGSSFLRKAQNVLMEGSADTKRSGKWGKSLWAGSRQDWLDNHWRHDWRSQPRDARGRWIPGRLDHVVTKLQYRGTRAGRSKRRQQKLRARRRAAGRKLARRMTESWKNGD